MLTSTDHTFIALAVALLPIVLGLGWWAGTRGRHRQERSVHLPDRDTLQTIAREAEWLQGLLDETALDNGVVIAACTAYVERALERAFDAPATPAEH